MQSNPFAGETFGIVAAGILLLLLILTLGIMEDIIMVVTTEVMAGIIKCRKHGSGALPCFVPF